MRKYFINVEDYEKLKAKVAENELYKPTKESSIIKETSTYH